MEPANMLSQMCHEGLSNAEANFYTIVTRDTVDRTFAANRQRFLTEQGYKYEIRYER